jgi:hypothetical protein
LDLESISFTTPIEDIIDGALIEIPNDAFIIINYQRTTPLYLMPSPVPRRRQISLDHLGNSSDKSESSSVIAELIKMKQLDLENSIDIAVPFISPSMESIPVWELKISTEKVQELDQDVSSVAVNVNSHNKQHPSTQVLLGDESSLSYREIAITDTAIKAGYNLFKDDPINIECNQPPDIDPLWEEDCMNGKGNSISSDDEVYENVNEYHEEYNINDMMAELDMLKRSGVILDERLIFQDDDELGSSDGPSVLANGDLKMC